jgi:hypothetical protein
MTHAEQLRDAFLSLEVNSTYSEAVLLLSDQTRLCFCHKVGERWAKSVGPVHAEQDAGRAGEILASIALFRLNAKHLDIQFSDGSRWERKFR